MEKINRPRGTLDITPQTSNKWKYVENVFSETVKNFNYKEIRFPVFEHTELFLRGVGDTTDVVQKEMYTFTDKGGRSITLRPEGTASCVRLLLENGLINETMPQKLYYITSCYRYEKPQAGRYREFHQFGAEVFGTFSPHADVEVLTLAYLLLKNLNISDVKLYINTIGCPDCRKEYHNKLKEYFSSKSDELCSTCNERLIKNPMRIFDCKSGACQDICNNAPTMTDYVCDTCSQHFDEVKKGLEKLHIDYNVDSRLVRGLDYYTNTVFEFKTDSIGVQGTVLGGGRYNGLVKELGGNELPGLGFAAGIERLILVMDACGAPFGKQSECTVYFAPSGDMAAEYCRQLVFKLRSSGVSAETDIIGRSLKAQMKYADKIGALYTVVIGDNELLNGTATLKRMNDGQVENISLDDLNIPTRYKV